MKKITPQVYQLGGIWCTGVLGANVFLLIDSSLTLIDTGFKGRTRQILKEIRRLGYSPSDIDNIIVTHHHADHTGSLAMLKEVTKAKVMAHTADAPYIDGRLPQPMPTVPSWLELPLAPLLGLWTTAPVTVDIMLNDGDELPMLGGIRVLHAPGHTPGSICLFLPKERLVIAGDVLVNTFGLSLPSKAYTVDIKQEIRSIQMVASLEFDIICFGHGPPLVGDARSAVVDFARLLQEKYRMVLANQAK
jgi:glyoxylase-like metal-dependent hydrolase (beta-lactamase superfamily II)